MGDYCGELFAERGGKFIVIGDLFVVKGYWLVGGNLLFLAGHLGNEPVKTSGVLRALAGRGGGRIKVLICLWFEA